MDFEFDLDSEWMSFCEGNGCNENNFENKISINNDKPPKCSDIYISTKTKISYLNQPIDLFNVFWKIQINEYYLPKEGAIKKQMKFNSITHDELKLIETQLETLHKNDYIDELIITQIDNPSGRIKFKDVRKISIGISKKDITSYRCKKKSAFYNCFVLMIRLLDDDTFKEIHVKVFNTGKLEIPGIQNDRILIKVLNILKNILAPLIVSDTPLDYLDSNETVLINSNFNCGYYIDRDALYNRLKYEYNLNSVYDPCSYPGIQSEFYYDKMETIQTGKQPQTLSNSIVKVSFMIFRTGSVLIVGKCTDEILNSIYKFIKNMLHNEYYVLGGKHINYDELQKTKANNKKNKVRKKIIILSN